LGLSMDELSLISLGFLYEMMTEQDNDSYDYDYIADQSDINKFF